MLAPPRDRTAQAEASTGVFPSWSLLRRCARPAVMGSGIGVWIGLTPAAGADVGAIIAWDQTRRFSRDPGQFGKGSPEGLVAASAGANSCIGGSLVTTLA